MSTQVNAGPCVRCGQATIPLFTGYACKAGCDLPLPLPRGWRVEAAPTAYSLWAPKAGPPLPTVPSNGAPPPNHFIRPSDPPGAFSGWHAMRFKYTTGRQSLWWSESTMRTYAKGGHDQMAVAAVTGDASTVGGIEYMEYTWDTRIKAA